MMVYMFVCIWGGATNIQFPHVDCYDFNFEPTIENPAYGFSYLFYIIIIFFHFATYTSKEFAKLSLSKINMANSSCSRK